MVLALWILCGSGFSRNGYVLHDSTPGGTVYGLFHRILYQIKMFRIYPNVNFLPELLGNPRAVSIYRPHQMGDVVITLIGKNGDQICHLERGDQQLALTNG